MGRYYVQVGAMGCARRRAAVVTDCFEQLLCPLNTVVPPAETVNLSGTDCVVTIAVNNTSQLVLVMVTLCLK